MQPIVKTSLVTTLFLSFLFFTTMPVWAENSRWQAFSDAGQEAYDQGKYKKAEHYWGKAVYEATRSDVGDENLALSLKQLAKCNIANQKFRDAETHLQRCIKINKELGVEDREAMLSLLELAKTYRSVNLEQFGQTIATILKQAGLNNIQIMKTPDGNRVQIDLADKFIKHLDSPDISQINIKKRVTFDISEADDGTITLNNIKGLKVRSKVWAALTGSSFQPNSDPDKSVAELTASKMGFNKTVQAPLPKPLYDGLHALVERIKHPELHSPRYRQIYDKLFVPHSTPHAKGSTEPVHTTPENTESKSGQEVKDEQH